MGITAQQILGSDPQALAYRLGQQELTGYMSPYSDVSQQGAGLAGGILGRGIANLFTDRGFFETQDPGLRAVSGVNKIISDTMSNVDLTDPTAAAEGYKQLARALASAGYSQPALLAAQEAQKATASIGAGYKESSNYMLKDKSPALFRNGKYYDAEGNEVKRDQLRMIPKDALGRTIGELGDGAPAAAGDTPAAKAAKVLAERQAKAKKSAAAGKDPLAPAPGDPPEVLVAKAQARAEQARQKAEELSNADQIGTQMVAP